MSWHLHLHRQDLLTPFLSARVYKGRFPSGKAAFLPAFDSGFSRWTAAQQQCYADELVKILASTQRNAWELYGSVEALRGHAVHRSRAAGPACAPGRA